MAFVLRRPMALAATLRQLPQASQPAIRQFHHTPLRQSATPFSKSPHPESILSRSRSVFQATFRRQYSTPSPATPIGGPGDARGRLIYGAAIFGGTLIAVNLVFNRETREDGGMPPFERAYLNDTFLHTGLGLGTIAIAARALHANGWSYRLMATSPWLVLGVGLVGSIGSMIACRATSPDK
jgi:hypothetical protein